MADVTLQLCQRHAHWKDLVVQTITQSLHAEKRTRHGHHFHFRPENERRGPGRIAIALEYAEAFALILAH